MIEVNQVRIQYNRLYTELRRYTWSFDVIQLLSSLESECYTAIPDIDAVRSTLLRLKMSIYELYQDDEDIKKVLDKFEDTLNNCEDGIYMNLTKVQEVVPA